MAEREATAGAGTATTWKQARLAAATEPIALTMVSVQEVPGRDHWPRAWSSVMMGGGVRGGQVIGRTDAEAASIVDRPVTILDFMATVCRILGIDHDKQNQAPNGRPIRIVDRGANPIRELL